MYVNEHVHEEDTSMYRKNVQYILYLNTCMNTNLKMNMNTVMLLVQVYIQYIRVHEH